MPGFLSIRELSLLRPMGVFNGRFAGRFKRMNRLNALVRQRREPVRL